ncbi:uncharacterized protein LOC115440557 isoform X1 [Manduca sexta]|uniref:uncharacterized protein LOC115440557 isoform X1 n=1 Tax=Manduca sexta TaxID=7130 RepID=UPI00188FD20A|nr:uncharacterized protein LOC115440557 isoform X1 [Manduca sexta]XP_030020791.2 uncharacterized protein LOC115440557 isoform X1 [Manduca sexta]XP_037296196.1 uncharacterized protein LOC115440557 isoform X1 [Manduca sexta]
MAPKKNYTTRDMERAIEAVRNGEKVSVAAQRFGVPRITLRDKLTGKTPIYSTMGPSTVLTKDEEDLLEKWLIADQPFPLTKDNILDSVQKIIIDQKRKNPFTNNRPSRKWFQSFLRRHPNLTQRIETLSRPRDDVTESKWFEEIEQYLSKHNLKDILNDGRRVFNADESAFFLSPKSGRVLAKKEDKHFNNGHEKDNVTVVFTGNAAGELAPPMIIFNDEKIPSSIAASIPSDWAIGKSENGWMCSDICYEYVTNVFNPWLEKNNIKKPILMFADCRKSHLTLQISMFCSQNGIEVIALYPNSTHIHIPMDLSVFRPLETHWKEAVTQWKMENLGQNLQKENFAQVLQKALSNLSKDCIKNGFIGLFPFGPDYIKIPKMKQKDVTKKLTKKTNSAQAEFVKNLESEIVKIFSEQKLQHFNEIYFDNSKTLENSLPNEDGALYIIWAKNKFEQEFYQSSSNEYDDINVAPAPSAEAVSDQYNSHFTEKDILTSPHAMLNRDLILPTSVETVTSTVNHSKGASEPLSIINTELSTSLVIDQGSYPNLYQSELQNISSRNEDIFAEQLPSMLTDIVFNLPTN